MSVQKELKKEAIRLGLCNEWQNEWGKPTRQELIDKYVKGIDFCIKHNYPSNEYIVENFTQQELNDNGIFVNERFEVVNPKRLICNGDCNGVCRISSYISKDMYIRGNSIVVIYLEENSRAFIRIYDNCTVKVVAAKNAIAFVYHYGGDVIVEGDVKIRKRNN